MKLKLILFILTIFISRNCKSQMDTIYFSITGDTLLYSSGAVGHVKSDTLRHWIRIITFNQKGSIKHISSFDVVTLTNQNVFKFIPTDTIKKYNFSFDGIRYDSPDSNIVLNIIPKKIKLFSHMANSDLNVYKAKIQITLTCKSKVIRNETIKYMFKGLDKESLNQSEIFDLTYWKKENTSRYFFWYTIKRKTKISKSGDKSSYNQISYLNHF